MDPEQEERFIELFGIQQEVDGEKSRYDNCGCTGYKQYICYAYNSSRDEYAIGYVSLGSLDESVKALKIDGAEATAENIENGSYKASRPFNIAVKRL